MLRLVPLCKSDFVCVRGTLASLVSIYVCIRAVCMYVQMRICMYMPHNACMYVCI